MYPFSLDRFVIIFALLPNLDFAVTSEFAVPCNNGAEKVSSSLRPGELIVCIFWELERKIEAEYCVKCLSYMSVAFWILWNIFTTDVLFVQNNSLWSFCQSLCCNSYGILANAHSIRILSSDWQFYIYFKTKKRNSFYFSFPSYPTFMIYFFVITSCCFLL